jgi:hypothetical protein
VRRCGDTGGLFIDLIIPWFFGETLDKSAIDGEPASLCDAGP